MLHDLASGKPSSTLAEPCARAPPRHPDQDLPAEADHPGPGARAGRHNSGADHHQHLERDLASAADSDSDVDVGTVGEVSVVLVTAAGTGAGAGTVTAEAAGDALAAGHDVDTLPPGRSFLQTWVQQYRIRNTGMVCLYLKGV